MAHLPVDTTARLWPYFAAAQTAVAFVSIFAVGAMDTEPAAKNFPPQGFFFVWLV